MPIRYPGRAEIDPRTPEALGICDRCGLQYNLRALRDQLEWAGAEVRTKRLLICWKCEDDIQPQKRVLRFPSDPDPVYDSRIEQFAIDEKNFLSLKQLPNGAPSLFPAVSSMQAELLNAGKIIEAAFADTGNMAAIVSQSHTLSATLTGVSALQGQFQGTVPLDPTLADTGALAALVSHGMRVAPTLMDTSALTASLQYTGGIFAEMAGTGQLAASVSLDARLVATLGDTSAMAGTLTQDSPPNIDYMGRAEDTTNTATYNFAGVNFGTAVSSRRIVLVLQWGQSSNTRTLNSVTIGGVGATIHQTAGASAPTQAAIVSALVPTGTSGTVTVSLSGSADRCNVAAYRAINETSGSPTDTATDTSVSSGLLSDTINVPAGGWVVAGVIHNNLAGSTFTWTGVNIDYQNVSGDAGGIFYTGGHQDGLSLQTGRTISSQCSNTGISNGTLIAMSWG